MTNNESNDDEVPTTIGQDVNVASKEVDTFGDVGDDKEEYDFENMTGLQMLIRQLSICRLKKNLHPTWKQRAINEVSPIIVFLYAISSIYFTILGIILIVKADRLAFDVLSASGVGEDWYFAYWNANGVYFILQSIVTTLSDVIYVDQPSIWHPIDRAMAWMGVLFIGSTFVILWADPNVRGDHLGALLGAVAGVILSVSCFSAEWKLKANGNIKGFVLCHTGWHTFGALGLITLVLQL